MIFKNNTAYLVYTNKSNGTRLLTGAFYNRKDAEAYLAKGDGVIQEITII